MPSIKDFNKKNKDVEQQEFDLSEKSSDKVKSKKGKKRRPHLENSNHDLTQEKGKSNLSNLSENVNKSAAIAAGSVSDEAQQEFSSEDSLGDLTKAQAENIHQDDRMMDDTGQAQVEEKTIKITDLPGYWGLGAGVVKAAAPKVVDVIENVANEWIKDGNFYNVPVGHPIAQYAVGEALRNAKKVEKKLEEKGVFMIAQIGVDYLKSKIKK